jgi:hypothetical protein
MKRNTRLLSLTLAGVIGFGPAMHAQSPAPASPPANNSGRSTALWTIAGAGAGFGIGLSAGLNKYDDAINSERKVWTSAVVGAAIGAAGGYLVSRFRNRRQAATTRYPRDLQPRPLPDTGWQAPIDLRRIPCIATTPPKSVIKVQRQCSG